MRLFSTLLISILAIFSLKAQSAAGAGELVGAVPVLSADHLQVTQFSGGAPANTGADYYKILYTTPDIEGVLDTASGLLVVPRRGDIEMAMTVFQRGTPAGKTINPSDLSDGGSVFYGSVLAGAGMITLLPDYLGQGEARGLHPYLDVESEAWAAVDMLYAVESFLTQQSIAWNGQLFVGGYSQGGHSGMALHRELEANYADDWPVLRSAPMSAVYDLTQILDFFLDENLEYPALILPAWIIAGLQEAEGTLYNEPGDVFAAPYDETIALLNSPDWENGNIGRDSINTLLIEQMLPIEGGLYPARLLREDYRQAVAADPDHPLRVAFRDNNTLDWSPEAPILLYYCEDDDIVPAVNTLNADTVLRANGADVTLINGGPEIGHISCGGSSIFAALEFFNGARTDNGRFVPNALVHDDSLRTYVTYVPPGYDGSEAWPVVFVSHGLGSNIQLRIFASRLSPVADTGRFLAVYPQALSGPIGPSWNVRLDPNGPDDVGFFSRMIDQLAIDYHIDPARVYASGMSQGGAMSHLLACQLSDRIAAVASVTGPMPVGVYEENCQLDRPVPVLHMHGTADPIVSIDGGPTAADPNVVTPPIADYVQFWVAQNACTGEPTVVDVPDTDPNDNSTVQIQKYEDCEAGTEVYYYIVENGSHVWPGGPAVPPGFEFLGTTVNQDIHASAEIWNFFNRHVHPDPAPLPELLDLTLQQGELTRNYLLYLPRDYDGTEPWPLVINMHGLGSNRHEQLFLSQMNTVADTAHFLVAYPQGTPAPQPTGGVAPAWNPRMLTERPDDIDFIDRLIDTIDQNWNVDIDRVYATGMSQGGVMSYILACNIPDRLAAIASVAGVSILSIDWTCTAGRPFPVLHMQGTADLIAPYNGGTGILGPALVYPPIRDQLAAWLDGNSCSADSTITDLPDLNTMDGSTVELRQFTACSTYTGADGSDRVGEVWFYTIEGGGHTWPDGPAAAVPPGLEQIFGNINRDINASSEIWNFFNRHIRAMAPNSVNRLQASEIDLRVFPNPVETELYFDFDLPESARIQVQVFNTLGQPVTRIADQQLPAGQHRLPWRVSESGLAPGLYYYRIQLDDRSLSRAVVIGQ